MLCGMKNTHRNDMNDMNDMNNGNHAEAQGFGRRGRLFSTMLDVTGHRGGAVIGIVLALALFSGVAGLSVVGAEDLTGNGAAQIEGVWEGKLVVGKNALTLVFNVFKTNGNGDYRATTDSPDQGAKGIPVSKVTVVGSQVTFEVIAVKGTYSGELSEDGTRMVGQWQQSGLSLPLELVRKAKAPDAGLTKAPAPADEAAQQGAIQPSSGPDHESKEIEEIEVRFPSANVDFSRGIDTGTPQSLQSEGAIGQETAASSGAQDIVLAGTLSMPRGQGEGPFPAVVLVSGSGLQNRDEEIMGHKPFKAIADYLARRGIAVLRYDDRGFGQSTGDASSATTFDFARDAFGALEFLAKTDRIDATRLGVVGHSEGGIVAAIIAAQKGQALQQGQIAQQAPDLQQAQSLPEASFIVMLAGPGVRGDELLLEQARAIAKASGASDEQIEMATTLNSKIYSIAMKEDSVESRRQDIVALLKKEAPELESQADGIVSQVLSPWVVQFLKLDPADYLRKVTIPVLALNGTKDLQVPAASNLPAIDKALKEAGNTHYRLVALDGLNHLFQHAKTGLPEEYAQLNEDFAPEALALMGDWIHAVVDVW